MRATSRGALVGVASLVTLMALGTVAHATTDPNLKCRQTVNKEFTKYVKTITKLLQKCNDNDVKVGSGQNAPGGGNLVGCDTKSKIPTALTKMQTKINAKCDAVGITPALIGWPATCPNFEGGTCANAISDGNSVVTCLDCIAKAAIEQAMDLYYLNLADPSGNNDLIKCQKAISISIKLNYFRSLKSGQSPY